MLCPMAVLAGFLRNGTFTDIPQVTFVLLHRDLCGQWWPVIVAQSTRKQTVQALFQFAAPKQHF